MKSVKLATNPTTIPMGRAFPMYSPPRLEERMSGKIGKIHGESIVTTPARNAKRISSSILFDVLQEFSGFATVPLGHSITLGIDLNKRVLVGNTILFSQSLFISICI